ncbi:MAG: 3-oxoacyl-ACP synthase [Bacteroidetes bacterium]|nr:MAG: 3-oxoacyl-ACP synthase [Bacteroidota bacterium]
MQKQIKENLYEKCMQFVENQIIASKKGIADSQKAANEETKSSAGDKYETTRSMMQIEIENYTKRLAESQKLQQILKQINFQNSYQMVVLGTLVVSNQGKFFMAIGIGKIDLEKESYFVISQNSPIGEKFHHKKVGESFEFHGKNFVVLEIY